MIPPCPECPHQQRGRCTADPERRPFTQMLTIGQCPIGRTMPRLTAQIRPSDTKAWDPSQPSRGLGDTIEKLTKFTGIKAAVKAIFPDCGCDKRRDKLNNVFPYPYPKDT